MRILLAAVAGLVLAGCQAEVPGQASADGFVVKDATRLRFRPVLSELPPGPAVGPPGQRQSTNPAMQEAAARALDCTPGAPDTLDGRDDPALPLVSCDAATGTRFVLGPGFLSGADVGWAEARLDPATGSSVVNLSFTAAGARTWAEWTGGNVGKQVTMPEAQQLAKDIAGA
ncbi:precorrin-3B C(17)-methyltransferase [Amycolatopsis sp. H6(2020)]|nr:precorrin-3B C(17)-methyltransferase [Amycolatopsis sp. H6(2020)]